MTNKPRRQKGKGRTSSGAKWFLDDHDQMTKAVRIIAPIECYSG